MAISEEAPQGQQVLFSPSVQKVLGQLPDQVPIAAYDLVLDMLELHPEYGQGMGRNARVLFRESRGKTALEYSKEEWISKLSELMRFKPVFQSKELAQEYQRPQMHGRLFVLGIGILDAKIGEPLYASGIGNAIESEIKEDLKVLLSERAFLDLEQLKLNSPATDPVSGKQAASRASSPPQKDTAIRNEADDLLNRNAFARYLARFVETLFNGDDALSQNNRDGAFAIHLSGSWGSGKTSLWELFIRELNPSLKAHAELEMTDAAALKDCAWIPCVFPAWQHQDMEPAWWPLMKHMSDAVKPHLAWHQRVRDRAWHLWNNPNQLIFYLGLLFLSGFIVHMAMDGLHVVESASGLNTVLGLIGTLLLLIQGFRGNVFLNSANSAQQFAEKTANPNKAIVQRMARLTESIGPKKLAVFIDNLDRCQSSYAIDLLEAVQTLFQNQSILFVVAADKNWLHACYEDHYAALSPNVSQPGQSLGMMFLEKAFQLTTPLPVVQGAHLKAYWSTILEQDKDALVDSATASTPQPGLGAADPAALIEALDDAASPQDLDAFVQGNENEDEQIRKARLDMAMDRLQSQANEKRLQHDLIRYAHMLAPNPRSMKLLANNINVRTALLYTSEMAFDRHQLYLWSILKSRWPKMMEDISKKPQRYVEIIEAESRTQRDQLYDKLPVEWKYLVDLLHSNAVQAIIQAKDVMGSDGKAAPEFDAESIQKFAPLL